MAERDVRFVQLFTWAGITTAACPKRWPGNKDTDQPTAALLNDLEQRGLLKDTLVVWGGEFGRTVYSQGIYPRPTTAIIIRVVYHAHGRRGHSRRRDLW